MFAFFLVMVIYLTLLSCELILRFEYLFCINLHAIHVNHYINGHIYFCHNIILYFMLHL